MMRILALISGEYGRRHVANIRANAPADWTIDTWQAPAVLPPVMDYPEDYLPTEMPPADLILAFGEHRGIAELIPEIARMTGARAVIAGIDSEAWLPRGLARQLRGWLADMGVACVTPKPLCALTEHDYGMRRRERIAYDDPLIAEFARHFGQPELRITVDPDSRTVAAAEVVRDTVCGCGRYVAERLVGVSVDDAEEQAGMLHHHYPCMASMGKDPDFGDTLMHISGHLMRDNVGEQVKPFKRVQYHVPAERSE
jgi:thymidylate synthase